MTCVAIQFVKLQRIATKPLSTPISCHLASDPFSGRNAAGVAATLLYRASPGRLLAPSVTQLWPGTRMCVRIWRGVRRRVGGSTHLDETSATLPCGPTPGTRLGKRTERAFYVQVVVSIRLPDAAARLPGSNLLQTSFWITSCLPTIEIHWANEPKGRMSISRSRAAAASSRWCTPRNLRRTLPSMPSPRREYDR
jgi:hypothetical protein